MMKLKVIFVNTNTITLESLLASKFLSSSNIEELEQYKVEQIKKEKACSFILKNKYIGDYYLNENGKPVSDHCYFNVSHSKGAVVLVKDSLPVGIDIEQIRPLRKEMIDYISSNKEKEYIKDDKTYYEIWTNKESIDKCLGTGIKSRLEEIPALPINGKKTYKEKDYFSKTIVFQNHVISVAREKDESFEIEIEEEKI